MLECEYNCSFEYQGNASKLVHTPLTDKCYLTLIHSMHLGYGGNPYDPAGTRKTESVKALGACIGRQVLVFNCKRALTSSDGSHLYRSCSVWCVGVFRRIQPTLGRADECHLPERAVDPSCDQDPRKGCLLAWPGDHCEPQCGYLHYHESSHEKLRWAAEVSDQSEAASQACGEERTRQRADRESDDVCRGFQECKDHGSTHCGVVLVVEAAAFYAATLRLKPPFSETHLVSRRSVAAGPQVQ